MENCDIGFDRVVPYAQMHRWTHAQAHTSVIDLMLSPCARLDAIEPSAASRADNGSATLIENHDQPSSSGTVSVAGHTGAPAIATSQLLPSHSAYVVLTHVLPPGQHTRSYSQRSAEPAHGAPGDGARAGQPPPSAERGAEGGDGDGDGGGRRA